MLPAMGISGGVVREQHDEAGSAFPSSWCTSTGKRVFDFACACLLLLILSPILVLVAALVAATSKGPILFRQLRVGRNGKEFTLFKFRSMRHSQVQGAPNLTRKGDSRITGVGRILRRAKLDELPQLLNVMRGDMSIVGPRPDLAEYMRELPRNLQQVLILRPGLTGASSVTYVNEEEVLSKVPAQQVTEYYIHTLFPRKIQLDLDYAHNANLLTDLGILIRTVGGVYRHSGEVR
jgi:lipopolysaccharide/colanic/teichoic acid biosynthesis glycosyltransferase